MTHTRSWTYARKVGTCLISGALLIALSPDVAGRAAPSNSGKLAFEGDRFGEWGLAAMRPDGSGIVNLDALPGAADVSWSPNGKKVAFEADPNNDGNLEVFVMNADGSNLVQLTDSPDRDYWPDWFPNGKQIAFTSSRSGVPHIYVMNADGSDQHALTSGDEMACLEPDVSPNGKQVVFSCETPTEPPTIWVANADGSNAQQLTVPGPGVDINPQWSPNGKTIVFSSNRTGTFEIYLMSADGNHQVQLTSSPGGDFNPTFSPDGQSIAWWKERFGQGDVWTMNRDGSDQVNITNSPEFEGFPDWHQGSLRLK